MSTYRFAGVPSPSSVSAFVTFTVSAWLAVAGGVIVAERPAAPQATPVAVAVQEALPAERHAAPVAQPVAAVAIAPEARMTIVVTGRRA